MLRLEDIPDWFRQTKDGKRIVAENEAQQRSAREELVHTVDLGNAKLTAELPGLDKAMETARAAEAKAAAALTEATAALRGAYAARQSFVWQCEREINRARSDLYRTADPAIERTLEELGRAIETARSTSLEVAGEHESPYTGKMAPGSSNIENVLAEVARLSHIAVEVETLLTSAEGDVPARLAGLRKAAGLPKLASAAA